MPRSSRSVSDAALPIWGEDLDDNFSRLADWLYAQNRARIVQEERQATSESVVLPVEDLTSSQFEALTGQSGLEIYHVFDEWNERNEESAWEQNDYAERTLAKDLLSDPDGLRVKTGLARHWAQTQGEDPDDDDFDEDEFLNEHEDAILDAFLENLREHSFFNYDLSVKGQVGALLSFTAPGAVELSTGEHTIEVLVPGEATVPLLARFNATPADVRDARRVVALSAFASFFENPMAADLVGEFARVAKAPAGQDSRKTATSDSTSAAIAAWPVAADAKAQWEALEAQVWAQGAQHLETLKAQWAQEELDSQVESRTPFYATQALRNWVLELSALDDALVSEELPGISGRGLKALGLDDSQWVALFDASLLDAVVEISPLRVFSIGSFANEPDGVRETVEWPALPEATAASLASMDAAFGQWEIPQNATEATEALARPWRRDDTVEYWFAHSALGSRVSALAPDQLNPLFALNLLHEIESHYESYFPREIQFDFTVEGEELEAMGYASSGVNYHAPSPLLDGEQLARTLQANGTLLADDGTELLPASTAVWIGDAALTWQQYSRNFLEQSARANRQGGLTAEAMAKALDARHTLTLAYFQVSTPHFFPELFRSLARVEEPSLRELLHQPAVLPWLQASSLSEARTAFKEHLQVISGSYYGALSADKLEALSACLRVADPTNAQTLKAHAHRQTLHQRQAQSAVQPSVDDELLTEEQRASATSAAPMFALDLRLASEVFGVSLPPAAPDVSPQNAAPGPGATIVDAPGHTRLLELLTLNSAGTLTHPVLLQDVEILLAQARQHSPEALRTLLDTPDALGQTALHRATSMANEPLIRLLLSYEANPNATDLFNRPPLLLLPSANFSEGSTYWRRVEPLIRLFMAYGADLNAQDHAGKTIGHLLKISHEHRAHLDGLGLRSDPLDRSRQPAVDRRWWSDQQRSEFDAIAMKVAMETPTGPLLPPRILVSDATTHATLPSSTNGPEEPPRKRSRRL